jgi:hypothetical protein
LGHAGRRRFQQLHTELAEEQLHRPPDHGAAFPRADYAVIVERIATIVRDETPYRLDYFGTVHNALGFALPGLADYSKDVFFLLHAVTTELSAGVAEITATPEFRRLEAR